MRLPHKFGKYALVSKIAQGGMAEIYRAKYFGEGGFIKDVAVKRILPAWSDNKEFVTMLCDEARALVHLQHQNIVQVYELGKDGDIYYISMEYVEGVDLRRLFRKISRLPLRFTCFIVAEILKALNFAHNRATGQGRKLNIIHRDVSPQNILLSFNGEVKVADFGIAKGMHRSFETRTDQVKGKYAYMSPEQASGMPVDTRTDLYAVGVILYEFLTSRRLYEAPNDLMTIEEVKRSALPEGFEKDIPERIAPIVRRALQKDMDGRYQTASEFLDDLNRFVFSEGLVTHGLELSLYLKEAFYDECKSAMNEDEDRDEFNPQTLIMDTLPSRFKRCRRYVATAAAAIAVMVAQHAPTNPSGSDEPPQKTVQPMAIHRALLTGTLSVHARPWGYVYIPGYVEKRETPLYGAKLKAGDYIVKVNYEPENKWVQQKITIAERSQITCVADFGAESNLKCR